MSLLFFVRWIKHIPAHKHCRRNYRLSATAFAESHLVAHILRGLIVRGLILHGLIVANYYMDIRHPYSEPLD